MSALKVALGCALGAFTGGATIAAYKTVPMATPLVVGASGLAAYELDAAMPGTVGRGMLYGGVIASVALTYIIATMDFRINADGSNARTSFLTAGFGAEGERRHSNLKKAAARL